MTREYWKALRRIMDRALTSNWRAYHFIMPRTMAQYLGVMCVPYCHCICAQRTHL